MVESTLSGPRHVLDVVALSDDEIMYWIHRLRRLIWQHSLAGSSPAMAQRLAHHRSRLAAELDRLRAEAVTRRL
jgi:hypothetical protein